MNTTLVIMAAGIGSRFGEGIKQLAKMGPNGEIIMDYSIYDAKETGFNKVVFIIRKDIEEEFKSVIGDRIQKHIDVEYVFQDINDVPEGFSVPEGRTKPWGTGQAVLCAKEVVKDPFVVINADDYYGKEAYKKLHDFLVSNEKLDAKYTMGMAGFVLKNTLSENGTVTRGICKGENGLLKTVIETKGIKEENGKILCDDPEVEAWVKPEDLVSMNMWAAYPDFIDYLEQGFKEFLSNIDDDPMKKEYLLPIIVNGMLEEKSVQVKILETNDRWFGVTYKEDKEAVQNSFKELIEKGVYPENLWND